MQGASDLEAKMETILKLGGDVVHSHFHHKILKLARGAIALMCDYLSVIGAFILIFGAVYGILKVIVSILRHKKGGLPTFHHVRIEIGNIIALGLELLVATDVLETLTKETHEFSFELLGKIGAVAAFRTVLAFFLAREVSELEHEEKEKHQKDHPHPKAE